jgi:hypothetical protein
MTIGHAWTRTSARLWVLIVALSLVAVVPSLAPSSARAASGIQLSLGYADSERANAVNFPTPWAGSPGVIFEGCTPATSPRVSAFLTAARSACITPRVLRRR